MEKRVHRRVTVNFKAKVICAKETYEATIENISETGIFKMVFPEKNILAFLPGENIVVKFQIPSGHRVNLNCEIKWVHINTKSPLTLKYDMGLNIINPPHEYLEFVKALHNKNQ
jgi:hypothetical protein